MKSLEIRSQYGKYGLYERDYNGVEVDRTLIARLTDEQAHAMAGDHTGIAFSTGQTDMRVEPRDLYVDRVQDRAPHTRAWRLRLGDEQLNFITDDAVRILAEQATVHFETGEPNWDSRAVEDIDDRIHRAREALDELIQQRDRLVARNSESPSP